MIGCITETTTCVVAKPLVNNISMEMCYKLIFIQVTPPKSRNPLLMEDEGEEVTAKVRDSRNKRLVTNFGMK